MICALLLVSILAVYWPVRHHQFILFDDNIYVYENRYVSPGLTLDGFIWAFQIHDPVYKTIWHPLAKLSHMLDCQVFELDPGAHHLVNVIFHMASTLLLFAFLRRATGALWPSAAVSFLFGLHPMHVEAVAWVAQRKSVLSTFFWMAALLSYAWYAERPDRKRYLTTLILFLLGIAAKPMLVTFPFVLLLMDHWPLKRFKGRMGIYAAEEMARSGGKAANSWMHLVREKIPFFLISAGAVFLTSFASSGVGSFVSANTVPLTLRISNAAVSYIKYIEKMIWPNRLAIFYPYPESIPAWATAGAFILLFGISFLAVLNLKKTPYLFVGLMWYLGTLVPVTGLIQAGLWPAMADRFVYIPFIGLYIAAVWGVDGLTRRWGLRQVILTVVVVALFSAMAFKTWLQVRTWKDDVSVFSRAVSVTENNDVALGNLGIALTRLGKADEALAHFRAAQAINPSAGVYNNIGIALSDLGDQNGALRQFKKALDLDPAYANALNNLGKLLAERGKRMEAFNYFQKALLADPELSDAYYNIGLLMFSTGHIDAALEYYTQALALNPNSAKAHNNIGIAFVEKNKISEAKEHFRRALEIRPDFAAPRNNLERLIDKTANAE